MPNHRTKPLLSPKFTLALQFAAELHANQRRKGGEIPYLAHLMAVSATVLDYGGTEDEAIGGLLHDAAEDCGGYPTLERIRLAFGDTVAQIVEGCTDSFADDPTKKEAWRARKERYVSHLQEASASIKLVAGADKLHNLTCTLRDLDASSSPDYWNRFTAGASEQAWYYGECLKALAGSPIAPEFERRYREFLDLLNTRWGL